MKMFVDEWSVMSVAYDELVQRQSTQLGAVETAESLSVQSLRPRAVYREDEVQHVRLGPAVRMHASPSVHVAYTQ